MKNIIFCFTFILLGVYTSNAQESEIETETESEEHFNHHQIGILLGHSHISQGPNSEGKKWVTAAMFSLNYNYWFNRHWALGVHTDIVPETLKIIREEDNGETDVYEREVPIAPALMLCYKPGKHFTYMLGAGEEFAKEENLFLVRAEVEYSVEMPKEFEFGAGIGYDIRFNAYDSWVLSVGVSKIF
ncbi:hypothetical protein [Formosa haliotis]|uniref:hypothetical protein n=1 Tax=Formosa haliotis TaxID=1555194 RepID=UPI00082717CA|nr:hypothetical protein [Formosa haliotis]